MKSFRHTLQLLAASLAFAAYSPSSPEHTCVIPALNNGRDDAPVIREAFDKCGNNGKVIFQKDTTYSIQTALQLHNLKNVQVDMLGTLEVIHAVD